MSSSINLPSWDDAFAIQRAVSAGGDTDTDTDSDMANTSDTSTTPSPPHPSFDIPANSLIYLNADLSKPNAASTMVISTHTVKLMREAGFKEGTSFYRLKWAVKYLSQGYVVACKHPVCQERCRLVNHDLTPLKRHMLGDYDLSQREHAVFLSVDHTHEGSNPQFMWIKRSVRINPEVTVATYQRWITDEHVFSEEDREQSRAEGKADNTLVRPPRGTQLNTDPNHYIFGQTPFGDADSDSSAFDSDPADDETF